MKTIIKAMNESQFKPKAKWWGFVKGGKRYLCRYNHIFAEFDLYEHKVVWSRYETITDRRGVEFAIKYFMSAQN